MKKSAGIFAIAVAIAALLAGGISQPNPLNWSAPGTSQPNPLNWS